MSTCWWAWGSIHSILHCLYSSLASYENNTFLLWPVLFYSVWFVERFCENASQNTWPVLLCLWWPWATHIWLQLICSAKGHSALWNVRWERFCQITETKSSPQHHQNLRLRDLLVGEDNVAWCCIISCYPMTWLYNIIHLNLTSQYIAITVWMSHMAIWQ